MMSEEEKQNFLDEDAYEATISLLIRTIDNADDPKSTARAIVVLLGENPDIADQNLKGQVNFR